MTPVTATPQTVPEGFCPQTFQEIVNGVSAYTVYEVPGEFNSYVISSSTPDPEDQGKIWIKTDVSGNPVGQFVFSSGSWIWPHSRPAGEAIELWMGDPGDIDTYDGGSAGAVTATTGPMWEMVAEAVGRTAVHPDPGGTVLPVNAPSVGDTFGEEEHTQTVDELVEHNHTVKPRTDQAGTGQGFGLGTLDSAGAQSTVDSTGGGQAFNVCQPSIGMYYIRRTARIYLVA